MYSCHSADNDPKAHGSQGDLKGSMKPIAQVFAEKFNFANVQGTKGSVNYGIRGVDYINPRTGSYTFIPNPNALKPYPENGRWVLFYRR